MHVSKTSKGTKVSDERTIFFLYAKTRDAATYLGLPNKAHGVTSLNVRT